MIHESWMVIEEVCGYKDMYSSHYPFCIILCQDLALELCVYKTVLHSIVDGTGCLTEITPFESVYCTKIGGFDRLVIHHFLLLVHV